MLKYFPKTTHIFVGISLLLWLIVFFLAAPSAYAAYVFYDSFDKSAIDSNKWDKTDTGSRLNLTSEQGSLKVAGNSAWNDPALYTTSTYSRSGGRAFVNIFRSNVSVPTTTYHFSTTQLPSNPNTSGYGIYMEAYSFYSVVPGTSIKYIPISNAGYLRSHDFAAVTVLRPDGGSYHLVSGGLFGTYPTATLLWVNQNGTDTNLYGGINFFGGNANVRSSKIVDLPGNFATQYGIANAADTFSRSNSSTLEASEIGNKSWIEVNGDWTVSNGKVLNSAGGVGTAVLSNVGSEGIYETDFTTGASLEDVGIVFRYTDYNNYVVAYFDSATPAMRLYKKEASVLTQLSSTGLSLSANTTYRFRVLDHDNKICIYIDNSLIGGSCTTSTYNTNATGAGIQVVGGTTTFDNVAFWPKTVTLPTSEIGYFPTVPTSGGTTLAQDTFTDSNSTTLTSHTMNTGSGWTVPSGTWTISSNVASPSAVGSIAVTEAGETDIAASADITLPQGYGADTEWYSGIIVRYQDVNNYAFARFLWQFGSPEIEVREVINGTVQSSLNNAVQLGSLLTPNSTHNQKVVVVGNQLSVYFDNELVIQTTIQNTTGTKAGIIIYNDPGAVTDPLSTFDNFLVTDAQEDAIPPPEVTDLAAASANTTSPPTLSWTQVFDDASGTSYYKVYRSTTSGTLGSQINSNGATTTGSYTDTSLSSSGTYYYTVQAVDAAGNAQTSTDNNQVSVTYTIASSSSSSTASSSSASKPTCPHSPPTSSPDLFQINTTNSTATLYFAPAGKPYTEYVISYGYEKDTPLFGTSFSLSDSTGAIAYTFNMLSPNTTYYFRVRAGNGCATGHWSSVLGTKTKRLSSSYYSASSTISSTQDKNNTRLEQQEVSNPETPTSTGIIKNTEPSQKPSQQMEEKSMNIFERLLNLLKSLFSSFN